MTFLDPTALWALVALGPLIAIYMLKVRPRRRPATAIFLWQQILSDTRATRLLHRFRDLLSLILMLIVFAAIAFAMARPELVSDARKDVLLLIDHSASMNAEDGGRTRLDLAKEVAGDIVRSLDGRQRVAVASVAGDVNFRAQFSTNPGELLEAIESIEPSTVAFRTEALTSLSSRLRGSEDRRVILVSDGCGGKELPPGLEMLKVGSPQGNVGFVACDLQRLPGRSRLGFYFRLASSFEREIRLNVLVSHGSTEDVRKVVPVVVQPGLNPPQVHTLDAAPAGRWIAQLEVEDALAADDRAYLSVTEPPPLRVAVESEDAYFLEHSVLAFGGSAGPLRLVEEDPEVIVAKGRPDGEARLSVLFQPTGESEWWEELGAELGAVVPRVEVPDHPALRYLDVQALSFAGARSLRAPVGSLILVAGDRGEPLIYSVTHGERSAFVINLDPGQADFYLSAWFPVMVHAMATSLAGRADELAVTYAPGATVNIPGVGEERYGPLEGPGFVEIENRAGSWLIACSLLAPSETLLDNSAVVDTSQPIRRGLPPWVWLIIAAVVLVTLEELLYHRRKVG